MRVLVLCRYTEERIRRDEDAIASGYVRMNNRALTPNSASSRHHNNTERQMQIAFYLLHYTLKV